MSQFTTCDRCGKLIQELPPLTIQGSMEQDPAVHRASFGFYRVTVAFVQFFHADGRVTANVDLCGSCVRELAAKP